jgi:hypothetical protein
MPFLTKYLRMQGIFLILYVGMPYNLLIVKIPNTFYKSRLSCTEIEVYANGNREFKLRVIRYTSNARQRKNFTVSDQAIKSK